MRLLFGFAGGRGHLEPLLPLARAATARGHDVAFTGRPGGLPAGFPGFPAGADDSGERRPLQRLDRAREEHDFLHGFGGWIARERAASTRAAAAEWRPDVIVCDEADFGSMIAAESLGIPHVSVVVLAAGTFGRPAGLALLLDETRALHGLPPDPGLGMLDRHLVISPVPPTFRPGGAPMRPMPPVPRQKTEPPMVYFTLGTIFNTESGDLFGRLLTGLRRLPVRLVVTVGAAIDPAELGPQPPHVRVERFVPQAELLPGCAAVVSHGGSGTVIGALAHGVPLVVVPMGADQPANADRVAELGLGLVLDAVDATPADAEAALHAVLTDPAFAANAAALREEAESMPPPDEVVGRLEALARDGA
ncbi:glycosyltransferase family 1 protein [Dactylosporangium vinaceum]|uniref:Glycosyltransferase n=1 Tax=Dactylosporangium vinaceum TaxID=53362 RepID=A0ABV5M6I7_9ACTN|nr:glycosyltransferase [Dactylosporangium vinaceum]UAB97865.1 glycosyltransferase family 1 protein [Dactylosporangium vinaceum]